MDQVKWLLRSVLFVPAYRKSFLDNGLKANADALVLDLEDAVPFEFKSEARLNISKYLSEDRFKNNKTFVRLNSLDSKLLFQDLTHLINVDIDGFMLTKVSSPDDITYYDKLMTQLESENHIKQGHFKFITLIETNSAIMDAYRIAKASSRNIALAFGGEDFLDDLHGVHGEPAHSFIYPRAAIAIAARAAGILPIDTPYLRLNDLKGFIEEERKSFELGYAGCLLIHPKQVTDCNNCFSPSMEEVLRSE